MSERRIEIHLSLPQGGGTGVPGEGTGPSTRDEPDAQARTRFEQALAATPQAPAEARPGSVASPFALFGTASVPPVAAAPQDPAASALGPQIEQAVERLLVDDDHRGRRQVRMDLKDDVLPGVSVVIQHGEGRLQVDFICSQEASRLRLNRSAPTQAQALAERLGCEVLLRVQTDDEEDPCLFEAAARP